MRSERLPRLTGIGGGIGAGKSVVCQILSTLGYKIYDCDSRAKRLMDANAEIISAIGNRISHESVICTPSGQRCIDRRILGEIVFNDKEKLLALNEIVHSAVCRDLQTWYDKEMAEQAPTPIFVESAIMIESGLDKMVSEIWEVVAPENVRLQRAMRRDCHTESHIRARIKAQRNSLADADAPVKVIVNDGNSPLLPQILNLLGLKH